VHRAKITVFGVVRNSSLEVVDAQILVAFAFSIPQDRSLDGLNVAGVNGIDLTLTLQLVTGLIGTVWIIDL
jgi:hypothetical protein